MAYAMASVARNTAAGWIHKRGWTANGWSRVGMASYLRSHNVVVCAGLAQIDCTPAVNAASYRCADTWACSLALPRWLTAGCRAAGRRSIGHGAIQARAGS